MKFYPEGNNENMRKIFASTEEAKRAIAENEICEGKVLLCDREHNLHIDLGAIRGIIPREEGAVGIKNGSVRDIALISKVGKYVCFCVTGLRRDEYGNMSAILSRRRVQEMCENEYLSQLRVGDVIPAAVTHLEKFGAFIDIGSGINSLIPIDMLSVSRISHPSQRLSQGQNISAVLRKREDGKLTFSLKELLGTWSENAALFKNGETVTGVVRSIEEYGVFVELMPNLAGLAELRDGIFEGQLVSVFIKSINAEKMKIKLVIVDAFGMEETPSEVVYFNSESHIDLWQYSPDESAKQIVTDFRE